MNSEGGSKPAKKSYSKYSKLWDNLVDSDVEMESTAIPVIESSAKPWKKDFVHWMEHEEIVPEGMDAITWWGVSASDVLMAFLCTYLLMQQLNQERYPVWASMALDYLAIMASSVSSERAFSSSGITISKRRNRLKGDIVEALQVLKCAIRTDLLVRLPMPSSLLEKELEEEEACEEELGNEVAAALKKGEEDFLEYISENEDYEDDVTIKSFNLSI